jgi:hypothetical protein
MESSSRIAGSMYVVHTRLIHCWGYDRMCPTVLSTWPFLQPFHVPPLHQPQNARPMHERLSDHIINPCIITRITSSS